MRCSACQHENQPDGEFCSGCGKALGLRCLRCRAPLPADAQFCSQCGTRVADLAQQSSRPTYTAEGERRRLTVLFCDLVGSTEIAARLDPEEWRDIAKQYQRTAAEAVTRFGGHVAQYLGDGLVVYFGYPQAHENDGERAVRAGLAILDAMAKLNECLAANLAPRLSARVGVHSGPVVVSAGGAREADVFGDTPNIAARVQTAAEPNTVLISAPVHRLVSGLFVVEPRGAHQLKGIAEPIELYSVLRASGVPSRFRAAAAHGLTPFAGRDDEMRLLMNRWDLARAGEGQVVVIAGEPGIGKSRLVQQFREQILSAPHLWLDCAGAELFDHTPFHAVTQMLSQAVGWQGDESDEERVAQLERSLEVSGVSLKEAVPLVAEVLNLPASGRYSPLTMAPGQKRQRLLKTLMAWVTGTARLHPVAVALEDLHWMDPSTLELVEMLVEGSGAWRILLLLTARPEFHAPWPMRPGHAQLTLDRLSERHVRQMVAHLAERAVLSAETVTAVVQQTTGIPLFVEELTRLVLEGNGRASQEIPHTLSDSLMARLDRLGEAREVAQVAAVIGTEFSYELLHAVAPQPEDELQAALARLAEAGLLHTNSAVPETTYRFKHALIQDAAYEALLKTRRKELHRRVAQTIRENFPAMAKAHPEVLARHWTDAGEAERALRAWRRVVDVARARGALKEAEEAARRGLAIVAAMPESPERDTWELELTIALLSTLGVTRGHIAPETVEALAHARALAEKTSNIGLLFAYLMNAGRAAVDGGDYDSHLAIADQLLDLAKREANPTMIGFAHVSQVVAHAPMGHFAQVEEHFAHLAEFLDGPAAKPLPEVRSGTYWWASYAAYMTGRADTARERIRRAIASAKESNSALELAIAQATAAMLYVYLREPQEAEALATQALALFDEVGSALYAPAARFALGWARAHLGRAGEGVASTRQAVKGSIEIGATGSIRGFRIGLAHAQGRYGALSEALDMIEEALRPNPQPPTDVDLALGLLARGELRLKQQRIDLAETDFRQAIAAAQRTGAKALALRSAALLARILQSRGDIAPARDLLAPLYASFTEGFDTKDLIEAKELLEELCG